MALAGTLSPCNMKVATLLCSISQKKASVFPVQYDVKHGSGICCLLYVEVYFFYTQQIEFLTWKDVTFCQRLFLSILNKHLIMLIECITCWKSLHQSQIAWQKVFPMFYQAQFPHTFSIFCYIYFGGRLVCVGVCLWRLEARLKKLVLFYNSMASGDQTQSSGRAMIPYLLSLLTGLVYTYLVNDFFLHPC